MNPLNMIDFYKADHRRQYPEGTEYVYSNFTPRSSRLFNPNTGQVFDDKVVFVGLQSYMKRVLIDRWRNEFFLRDKDEVVAEYKNRMDASLGVDAVPTDHIEALHNLGYLPIRIKALPEGSRVNIGVPMFTLVNTMPEFFWLTNYLETSISAEVWKPCTTATIAHEYKRLMNDYAEETGASTDTIPIQCHDFSYRGMSGSEDAAQSGIGHLTSFIGTDSVVAIDHAEQYYGNNGELPTGVSVPATEHSVMCMGGKEDERETLRRLSVDIYPSGIFSVVADTWSFFDFITNHASSLKDEILNRTPDENGMCKTVFRPDSGNPVDIICGDSSYPSDSPEGKGAMQCLWEVFGGTINEKGYKVLNEKVGLIYGDSITLERAEDILVGLMNMGFASSNIVFGVGSYTYQHITRDTFGFAMKATWGVVNGEPRAIFKDPVTDSGDKKSARGLLRVDKVYDDLQLVDDVSPEQEHRGELKTVFLNGTLTSSTTLDEIRDRLS